MATLICFGLGYCAEHFLALYAERFDRVFGTVRSAARAALVDDTHAGRVKALVFDGSVMSDELAKAIAGADCALISIPPDDGGDPALAACGAALAQARRLRVIVYLSTIGVYGDCAGAWVDETTPVRPASRRARERLGAERGWAQLGARHGIAVAILRLAGIYGPGRNALEQIAGGTACRIAKPGQVFNRIHVADIAQAIDAAFRRKADGVFNLADDAPSPPGDPIVFAAALMGVPPPPEIPFADAAATLSPLALSFWQECRRVRNDKLKRELGVTLRYPTYREGLRALSQR